MSVFLTAIDARRQRKWRTFVYLRIVINILGFCNLSCSSDSENVRSRDKENEKVIKYCEIRYREFVFMILMKLSVLHSKLMPRKIPQGKGKGLFDIRL